MASSQSKNIPEIIRKLYAQERRYGYKAGDAWRRAIARLFDPAACKHVRYKPESIWNATPQCGKPFAAYGEKAMRWIENPSACGLRRIGEAHDIIDMRHKGWYLDDFQDETARGVVYQLPGRKHHARYLAGYETSYEREAVCLSMEIYESDDRRDGTFYRYDCDDDAKRDAARAADSIAERMAEESREWYEANDNGRAARKKVSESVTIGTQCLVRLRRIRREFLSRREALADGVSYHATRNHIRKLVREARDLCMEWQEARREAFQFLEDSRPGRYGGKDLEAWREGYANG